MRDDDAAQFRLNDEFSDFVDGAGVDVCEVAMARLAVFIPSARPVYTAGSFGEIESSSVPLDATPRAATLNSILSVGVALEKKQADAAKLAQATPVKDLKRTLAHYLDFTLFYADFSRLSVLNSLDGTPCELSCFRLCRSRALPSAGLHIFPIPRATYLEVRRFITELSAAAPTITHTTLLFDGHVVWGSRQPKIDTLYRYMRSHCHHVMVKQFVPHSLSEADVSVFVCVCVLCLLASYLRSLFSCQASSAFHVGPKPGPGTPPGFVCASAECGTSKGFQPLPLEFPMLKLVPVSQVCACVCVLFLVYCGNLFMVP